MLHGRELKKKEKEVMKREEFIMGARARVKRKRFILIIKLWLEKQRTLNVCVLLICEFLLVVVGIH